MFPSLPSLSPRAPSSSSSSVSSSYPREYTEGANNPQEVGDYVEADEEIATIETDKVRSKFLRNLYGLLMVSPPKIDVSVNAPAAGTIKEFLVAEEDTVEVGQGLLRLELGGAPAGGDKPAVAAKEEPKGPADVAPKAEEKVEKKEEKKPEAPKQAAPAPKEAPKPQSSAPASTDGLGHREERRVSTRRVRQMPRTNGVLGENEPHAPSHC